MSPRGRIDSVSDSSDLFSSNEEEKSKYIHTTVSDTDTDEMRHSYLASDVQKLRYIDRISQGVYNKIPFQRLRNFFGLLIVPKLLK
jgi:hypothetical protein